ncbi:MAG: T9SS type A sorting domain-containing protein, partial [Candidatus Marinimicrobia bacterium]|nr:T9SS type A sorting domain-containing protein [Candidatus Neomarinimicrobiota bacterium]
FEGNESWGYNPSFYFAVDKYYGPKEDLKRLVNEAHSRGMGVVMDMVLNHSFGQSPMVQLYGYHLEKDENNDYEMIMNMPNPYYNQKSPNRSYHWGADFNHESRHTQYFIDRVNEWWIDEYHIDGFRFDFTKGLTNKSGDGWQKDDSRIAILKNMADHMWDTDSTAYVILEHLTDNSEEEILADYGMLLWGNMTYNYGEAVMAYWQNGKSNFSWGYYRERGWSKPYLVTYMESHDEERLMAKNIKDGACANDPLGAEDDDVYDCPNTPDNYTTRTIKGALERQKLVATFFLTLPGPKMIWQFGELGFDHSIDAFGGRLANKPPVWDYLLDTNRAKLHDTYSALNHLRKKYTAFSNSGNVSLDLAGKVKTIKISGDINAVIVGNFDVFSQNANLSFVHGGDWYEYFTGTILATDGNETITLYPGQFLLYTDQYVENPWPNLITEIKEGGVSNIPNEFTLSAPYPNPFNPVVSFDVNLEKNRWVEALVFDIRGRRIKTLLDTDIPAGSYNLVWNSRNDAGKLMPTGIYFIRVQSENHSFSKKIILLK